MKTTQIHALYAEHSSKGSKHNFQCSNLAVFEDPILIEDNPPVVSELKTSLSHFPKF